MHAGERERGRRQSSLVLVCLTLFVVLLPLTLTKPGIPVALKADEAAYYLAALSFWHDGDLVCDDGDARRLFREYPGTRNLKLISRGGGRAYFGVPFLYPLVATPWVALFGANGMVALNAALLMVMVWIGYAHLRRWNGESLSTLFAAGYFLLSTAFVYVFWLQAEVFNMACVTAAFFLGQRAVEDLGAPAGRPRSSGRTALDAAGSAALLTVVAYSRPMLAVLVLPLLYPLLRARAWRRLATFGASALLTLALLAGTAYGFTRQVWPYFGPRMGIALTSPIDYMERKVERRLPKREAPTVPVGRIERAVGQFRVTVVPIVTQGVPEFLFGRHGGFLIYMPFAVLAIGLFLLHDRRSVFRWLIVVAAAFAALLFMTLIRGHWLGGAGFVGNRYFSAVYPAFFFLVTRVRPAWLTAIGYGAAAIFLGPALITPLGAPVAEPTLQAHVRNQPLRQLPLEWSLVRKLSGYRRIPVDDVTLHARRTEVGPHDGEIWVHGAKRVEIHILSREPRRTFAFDVRNLASGNVIELCLEGDCRTLEFGEVPAGGATRSVAFAETRGRPVPRTARASYRYRLIVDSHWGEQPRWRGSGDERFYLGAALKLVDAAGEDGR